LFWGFLKDIFLKGVVVVFLFVPKAGPAIASCEGGFGLRMGGFIVGVADKVNNYF